MEELHHLPHHCSPSTSSELRRRTPKNDAGELHRPISSSSLGRSFPNEFFFYSISSFKPQARKTTPSYSKPSPSP